MKRILVSIFLSLLIACPLRAQDPQRVASTKVVDALNLLPAKDKGLFNRLMQDLVSTSGEGVSMLAEMLEHADKSRTQAQYALRGMAVYLSRPEADAREKAALIENLFRAAATAKSPEAKAFLNRQIELLGGAASPGLSAQDYTVSPLTARLNAKEILQALDSPDSKVRVDALNDASLLKDAKLNAKIIKKMRKLGADAKADIIYWIGQQKQADYLAFVIPYLGNSNFNIVTQAATACVNIGGDEAIQALAQMLTDPYSKISNLALEHLKLCKGDVCGAGIALMDKMSANGKMALMKLIAYRKALAYRDTIFHFLGDENPLLQNCAYDRLKDIVEEKDLNMLYNLLENTEESHIPACQEAVWQAMGNKDDAAGTRALFARQTLAAPVKRSLYWPLLARTQSPEAIAFLGQCYADARDDEERRAAFAALCQCKGTAAAEQLYDICVRTQKAELFQEAMEAYINSLDKAGVPGAELFIFLRKGMEIARSTEQKRHLLSLVARADTYPAILFAGRFLDDPALQQTAVRVLMKTAVDKPQFHSAAVTALLRRMKEVIAGPEKEYEIAAIDKYLSALPSDTGFVPLFNGKDLEGWQGLVGNPVSRASMTAQALAKAQKEADAREFADWTVQDGKIVFSGTGFNNLCTVKEYGDFELYADWLLYPEGPEADAGIYLRGSPQVQIWDTSRVNVGAQVGSGGLYNNLKHPSKPSVVADNRLGEWNSFRIKMTGERVSVWLNGIMVVDNVIMENYWDRNRPIFATGPIELQAHGSKVAFRDLYIREFPRTKACTLSAEEQALGFELLFDGTNLQHWEGNTRDYVTENGCIAVRSEHQGSGGDLYTVGEYADFIFRFEFKLTPGANNGVGIRAPGYGDAAYEGMEIQILDHYDPIYQPNLLDYQYHGSVYGIIPARRRDALRPTGEWNEEEIYAKGSHIRVTLNNIVITEGDIEAATQNGTCDHREHPGLHRDKGRIGFLGHGSKLWLRNIRIKEL